MKYRVQEYHQSQEFTSGVEDPLHLHPPENSLKWYYETPVVLWSLQVACQALPSHPLIIQILKSTPLRDRGYELAYQWLLSHRRTKCFPGYLVDEIHGEKARVRMDLSQLLILWFILHVDSRTIDSSWTKLCPVNCTCNPNTQEVTCSGIANVPDIFPTGVKFLQLTRGNITCLGPESFRRNLEQLEYLKLDKDSILKITKQAFKNLVLVSTMDISNNNLTSIHPDTFLSNINLEYLRLSRNSGLDIGQHTNFINSFSIRHLSLRHCNIRTVSTDTFSGLTKLSLVDLTCNPLYNCNKQTTREFLMSGIRLMCDNKCSKEENATGSIQTNNNSIYSFSEFNSCDIIKTGNTAGISYELVEGTTHTPNEIGFSDITTERGNVSIEPTSSSAIICKADKVTAFNNLATVICICIFVFVISLLAGIFLGWYLSGNVFSSNDKNIGESKDDQALNQDQESLKLE
uniref:Uncharacterized protein n=1 Tax=Timema poppense TaxID=170557 RepID=A0A7R9DB08_TIMPO|nr:unnamed protein product [Timema poppensis]